MRATAAQPAGGAEIRVICGTACAGRTTTARLLGQRLSPAAHVDGDEMRRRLDPPGVVDLLLDRRAEAAWRPGG